MCIENMYIYRKWSESIYAKMMTVGSRIREEMGGEIELFIFHLYASILSTFL